MTPAANHLRQMEERLDRRPLTLDDLRQLAEHDSSACDQIAGYLGLAGPAEVRAAVERGEVLRGRLPLGIQLGLLACDYDARVGAASDAWKEAAEALRGLVGAADEIVTFTAEDPAAAQFWRATENLLEQHPDKVLLRSDE
jgi:hypothetical protein